MSLDRHTGKILARLFKNTTAKTNTCSIQICPWPLRARVEPIKKHPPPHNMHANLTLPEMQMDWKRKIGLAQKKKDNTHENMNINKS